MALRYWVTGGTGNVNSTTNWSTSSGGASGASVPTTTDDAIFDGNSGVGTVTVNAAFSVLNLNFSAFNGTLAGTQGITMNGGTLTFGAGMTVNWTGNLSFGTNGAGTTIVSNGKQISGVLIIATGFAANGTITFTDDFYCGSIQHVSAAVTVNLNGADIYLKGSATAFSMTSGRILQGTSTIRLVTTTSTLSISITGNLKSNVVINATNQINQIGQVVISNSTWTYTSGVWNPNLTQLTIAGDCILNLAGMSLYNLAVTLASTITLTSTLNVLNNILMQLNTVFTGTHGFITSSLTLGTNASNGRTLTLKAGITYTILTGEFKTLSLGYFQRCNIISDTPGSKAYLTLPYGAIAYPAFVNVTDIDSSNGRLIKVFNGTLTNTINWLNTTSDVATLNTAP